MVSESIPTVKRRDFIQATGAGLGAGVLAGCSGGGGSSDDPISVAGLLPLSGIYAPYGPMYRNGMEMAFSEYNEDGGVLGRDIELLVADNADSGEQTVNNFQSFVQEDNAVAACGPGGLAPTIQAANFAEQNQVPLYTLAGLFNMFVNGEDTRYVFKPPVQGMRNWIRPQAEIVRENGYSEIGVIYQNGTLKQVMETALQDFFPEEMNLHTASAPPDETDFSSYLRQMPTETEMFVGTAHPPGSATMYSQMYELGFDPDLFTTGINPAQPSFSNIGEQAGQAYSPFTQVDYMSDAYQSKAQEYADQNDGFFDTTAADGYVTGRLIGESIKEAGSADPTDIADASRNITLDTLYIEPLQFKEWGIPDQAAVSFYGFDVDSSPDHYPDLDFGLSEIFRSDPMPGLTPSEMQKGYEGN
jgi:branched-chain amino acid transport system substrate-binding protein